MTMFVVAFVAVLALFIYAAEQPCNFHGCFMMYC